MALLHQAELRPSKLELLSTWASAQHWFDGDADADLASVAAYRFDDPDGEVGIETLLIRGGDGPVLQVPVTYRNSPLPGADAWLIGNMEHSVLGKRWVYDGAGDPAYLAAVAAAILTGGTEAELRVEIDGEMVRREPTATVQGSGESGAPVPSLPSIDDVSIREEHGATVVETGRMRLVIARVLGAGGPTVETLTSLVATGQESSGGTQEALRGRWTGQPESQTLVLFGELASE